MTFNFLLSNTQRPLVEISILNSQLSTYIVAPLGVEPRRTEPESAVLPLHNRAIKSCPIQ